MKRRWLAASAVLCAVVMLGAAAMMAPYRAADSYHVVWPANTTGVVVHATAGQVYSVNCVNNHASAWRYVKLYDKATAATSADTPKKVIGLPPLGGNAQVFHVEGKPYYSLGLSARVCTGAADNDNTAPGAAEVIVGIEYR